MAVRIKDGIIPYTGGQGIEITNNHVINVLLREMNNLIMVNEDRELYVDLQLPSNIRPTDTFPVGVTTGKILQANGWTQSGIILNRKTTSGDYVRLIYANDGKLYYDPGTGVWREIGGGSGDCKVLIEAIPQGGDIITQLVSEAYDIDNTILVFKDPTYDAKRWYAVNVFAPDDGNLGCIQAIGYEPGLNSTMLNIHYYEDSEIPGKMICSSIEKINIDEPCKVEIFELPQVGDNIDNIYNTSWDLQNKIVVLTEPQTHIGHDYLIFRWYVIDVRENDDGVDASINAIGYDNNGNCCKLTIQCNKDANDNYIRKCTGVTKTTMQNTSSYGSTAPANPIQGSLWYDTANSVLKIYDGSNRQTI